MKLEPAAGGGYAELVSSVSDYTRFARMLTDGGRFEGRQIVPEEHLPRRP